ncbi:MAG: hypothetical protein JW757_13335 [Anaerolineales bacterium]|nr:hypothetical protein [Anaerolineales bacterium]
MDSKPGNVQIIGIMMIASGVLNILAGAGIAVGIVIGTLFLGLICLPILVIPIGVGIFEIVTGANVLNGKLTKHIQLVAGLEIASILWANFLSLAGGILVLVFYNDDETKAYFEDLNRGTISM